MDALHEAKTRIEQAYYDERGMAEVMRQGAAVYAAIASAEAAQRQADALERIADALEEPPKMHLDMSDAIIRIADKINELRAEADPTAREWQPSVGEDDENLREWTAAQSDG